MNKHHPSPLPIQPASAEDLKLTVNPTSPFFQLYLAMKRAHYLGMARKPRDAKHRKFCMKELKVIDRLQEKQHGYTKKI